MMKKFLLFICLCMPAFVIAQDTIVNVTVPRTPPSKPGRNQKLHRYLFFEFGTITGAPGGAGSAINYWKSYEYGFGLGFKYKFTGLLSTGLELFFRQDRFNLSQDSLKTLPDGMLHKKEILRIQQPGALGYLRVNFDPKRGNKLGKYLDLGFWATWISGGTHLARVNTSPPYADRTLMKNKGLNFLESVTYGPEARIGLGHLSFFGRYRLEPLVSAPFDDLPPFTFGVKLGS